MLFKHAVLKGIKAGRISLAFRRWKKPTIKAGSELHTAIGLLQITSLEAIAEGAITAGDASKAGYAGRAQLLADLAGRAGDLYRIGVRYVGADPRIALRADSRPGADMLDKVARLAWAQDHLDLIAEHPAVRAADLAVMAGLAMEIFKGRIRKLKSLGLTESLDVGYRLSPRGKTLLKLLKKRD